MVSPNRYLAHHKDKAKQIEVILTQFGCSGETPGFWCNKGKYTKIHNCIECERTNFCHHTPPPLKRIYNPDNNHGLKYRGDMALWFLMNDRELGNKRDWLWLQHPETRTPQEVIQ